MRAVINLVFGKIWTCNVKIKKLITALSKYKVQALMIKVEPKLLEKSIFGKGGR